jgi:DNA-binding transcriptional MerR regulator
MNNLPNFQSATFESTWVDLQEIKRVLAEKSAEADRRMQETDRQMQETDRRMQETDRQMQETDRRMKKLQELIGSWDNNHGSFAEEYFFNSFEKGEQNFFGEKFNEIEKNLKVRKFNLRDEYDIVMYNGASIAIVEVKFKAHENDIQKVLNKAKTFRILCPDYKDFKIYLGFASMSFYPELEQECIDQGIAIIKQVGDMVIINDEGLKAF